MECSTKLWILLMVAVAAAENPVRNLVDPSKEFFENLEITFEPRITGGSVAIPYSFPYQVALRIVNTGGSKSFCGGSLISTRFVVTAAHCVDGVESITVLLGAHSIRNKAKDYIELFVPRRQVIVHERWNRKKLINDIALIEMPSPVEVNNRVRPINLPRWSEVSNSYVSEKAVASGWGVYSDQISSISSDLRFVNLTIITENQCKRSFGSSVRQSNICTSGSGGTSTCNGDSGGPLAHYGPDDSRTLIGITSYGSGAGCERGMPAVFTRVTSYLKWIVNNSDVELRN